MFALLDAGFAVRGTCRSQAKADEWSKWNPHARIEWTIVENIEVRDRPIVLLTAAGRWRVRSGCQGRLAHRPRRFAVRSLIASQPLKPQLSLQRDV